MNEPAPLAADVPGYDDVGRAPAFPVLTKVVLSRFRRPRLPLEPGVSARNFLPDQEEVSLLCDFWQFEENALATIDLGHTPSQSASSVWNVWHKFFCNSRLIRSVLLWSTFDKFPINGVDHVVRKVPYHRRADPVRWNLSMADCTASSATLFAQSK